MFGFHIENEIYTQLIMIFSKRPVTYGEIALMSLITLSSCVESNQAQEPSTTPTSSETNVSEAVNRLISTKECSGCDLSGANLTEADLENAILTDADLSGANLVGADLEKANLIGANLSGANLQNADLDNAILSNSDLSQAILIDAEFDQTIMPDGTIRNYE